MSEKENTNQTENTEKEVLSEEEMENVNGGGYFDGLLGYKGPAPTPVAPKPVPAPAPKPVVNTNPPTTTNIYGQTIKRP